MASIDLIGGLVQATSLLRAQNASIIALKTSQQNTQATVNLVQKTADQAAQQNAGPRLAGTSSANLPRGSLVNIVV